MGEALVGSHIAGGELWVRVERESWADLAAWLRNEEGFGFFNFLSAIDWMPSPFGRDMDSTVDNALDPPEPKETTASRDRRGRRRHALPGSWPE